MFRVSPQLYILLILLFHVVPRLSAQSEADSLHRQLSLYESSGDTAAMARTEYALGKFYYSAYADSLCAVHLKRCRALAQSAGDARTRAIATNMLGNLMGDTGDHVQAIRLFEEAIRIARENDTLRAVFMNNLGLELKALGRYKEAIEVMYGSLELKEKIHAADRSRSATLLNIGMIWDLLEQPDQAVEFYERSMALKKAVGDSLGIARILSNLSVIAKNDGRLEQALSLIAESRVYNRFIDDFEQHYTNHVNLANIGKLQGKPDLFQAHMDSAFYYATELNNPDFLSDIHQNLGTFYFEQHDYPKAISHLNLALRLPGEHITQVLLYENHRSLAKAYGETGDYRNAYRHLEMSNLYKDSLFKGEHQLAIQEVREKYESEHKEKELIRKDLELANSSAEARRKTIIILFLSGGILIAALLAFILFRNYREVQRRKLIMAEQKLEKYREELETLRVGVEAQLNQAPGRIEVRITREDINQYLIDPLTDRELQILTEIASGKTNKEIAEAVHVSENTVKFHLKNIYLKLDVKNRTEAITKADALNIWNRL